MNNAWRTAQFGFAIAAIGLFAQATAGAQDPAPPAFEVASVRRITERTGPDRWFRMEHGSLTCRMGLKYIISQAYGLPFDQVRAPELALSEVTVEILAKAAAPVPEVEVRHMLRTLLVDRFKLRAHVVSEETSIFALMVGKGGHRLQESNSEGRSRRQFDGLHRETFTGFTMADFAGFLAMYSRGTLDRTGLAGRYDFVLDYRGLIDPEEKSVTLAVISSRGEAIRQVGLQLQAVKSRLEFLVVDQLEKIPTRN